MSLATDQTLNPGSYGGTAGDKVYNLIGQLNSGSTLRRVASTATTEPDRLTISHRLAKKGTLNVDEHLIRIDETVISALSGAVDYSAWLVIKAPRGVTEVTVAKIKSQVGRVIHTWMTSGNADKILNGEM